MRFESAKKGIKKLFLGEILSIVASILLIASLVYLAMKQVDLNMTGEAVRQSLESGGVLVPFLVFSIAGLLLFLASYVLSLAGIINGAHDEESFKRALWAELALIALTIASAFLQDSQPQMVKWLDVVSTVARMMVTLLVIGGIDRVAAKLGKTDVVIIGEKSRYFMISAFLLSAVFEVMLVFFFQNNPSMTYFFRMTVYVLDIIAYVLYLRLLNRARMMGD